jgi:osmotically-inducible protein OsmY
MEAHMTTNFRNRIAVLGAALMLGGVLGGCANTGEKMGTAVDDTAITTKVKSAFATDKEVSAMAVHVKTTNGRVQLSGKVKSYDEKRKAEDVARRVAGVTGVENDLQVASN